MKLFLTSSPSGPLDHPNDERVLDNSNGFVDHLKSLWKMEMKGLMISADPYNYAGNDEMVGFFTEAFNHSNVPVVGFKLWDYRSLEIKKEILMQADVIMLAGGHLPTQNAFFEHINLKSLLEDYKGIIIGVSAGTMNCAECVYVQPELPYEAINPGFQRFTKGLGLTKINILPHYQLARHMSVDGLRLYEDITLKDSYGKMFIALPDGSYVYVEDERSVLYGEAYLIQDGKIHKILGDNEQLELESIGM